MSGRMTRNPYKAWPGANLRTSRRQSAQSANGDSQNPVYGQSQQSRQTVNLVSPIVGCQALSIGDEIMARPLPS
jgi:hypothetical protein